jgi:hypothetical protein
VIGRKYVIDVTTGHWERDRYETGIQTTSGVFDILERGSNKLHTSGLRGSYFGICVMPGAKFVVSDELQEEESNKTIFQEGSVLIIGTDLYFKFWNRDFSVFNAQEMEEKFFRKIRSRIRDFIIIFLLRFRSKSSALYLTIHHKEKVRQWSQLRLAEDALFRRIMDWNPGFRY